MKKNVLIVILTILATIFININIDKNVVTLFGTEVAPTLTLVFCAFLYVILQKCDKIDDKRLKICAFIISCIFATIQIVGYSLNTYLDLSNIISSKIALFKNMIKWTGYVIIFYSFVVILFNYITKVSTKIKDKEYISRSFFTNNKKSFFICMVIIFLAWLPYLLRYFPGIATADSMSQVLQALDIIKLNNHHPIAHTGLIWIGISIGKLLGNYNVGIAIYSIVQMLIMAAIFSFAIYYMAKKNVPIIFRGISLMFFALYPVNALYSITMWKDIIFSGSVLLVVISITEIITNKEEFFSKKLNLVFFTLEIILMIVFRNNGIYVAIFTIPFLALIAKKYFKHLLIIFCAVLAVYVVFKGPIFSIFNIKDASVREALSIPLQQFARIASNREDITQEEKDAIYNFLPIENYKELYIPTLSDPIKAELNEEYFKENKIEFIGLWVKLVVKYPIDAIESFLCNSYGYWYPEAQNWVVSRKIYKGSVEGGTEIPIDVYQTPIIQGKLVSVVDSFIERRNIPIVSLLFSIGFVFWIILAFIAYIIYKKDYKMLVAYIPILVLWLTCIASPVYCEYRYIYSMFITLPITMAIVNMKIEE